MVTGNQGLLGKDRSLVQEDRSSVLNLILVFILGIENWNIYEYR